MKKRICSIVLAVLMLVCFTIPAFAADVSNTTIIDCGDGYYLRVCSRSSNQSHLSENRNI